MSTTTTPSTADLLRVARNLTAALEAVQAAEAAYTRAKADYDRLSAVNGSAHPSAKQESSIPASEMSTPLREFLNSEKRTVRVAAIAAIFFLGPMRGREVLDALHRHGFDGLRSKGAIDTLRGLMWHLANDPGAPLTKTDGKYTFLDAQTRDRIGHTMLAA